jgi:hypothetical protein
LGTPELFGSWEKALVPPWAPNDWELSPSRFREYSCPCQRVIVATCRLMEPGALVFFRPAHQGRQLVDCSPPESALAQQKVFSTMSPRDIAQFSSPKTRTLHVRKSGASR